MKHFFKFFVITLIVFTFILTPAFAVFEKMGDNIRIFDPGETILAKDLQVLVDQHSPFFDAFTKSERVNILLMGLNTNLTDTLLLASYDMNSQHVDLISIPRDTYYPRESAKYPSAKKINAAYHDGGAIGSATAVSDLLLGIPINFYMEIKYEGVYNIVDAMGGIPVTVPFHMYYTDPYDKPPLVIDIPAGDQILKGKEAVEYLRFRKGNKGYPGYPEGDIGRIKAQQDFMISAFKQTLGPRLPAVITSVLDNVKSDLTIGTALQIAKRAANLSSDSIKTYTIPGEARTGEGGLSFFFCDTAALEDMITEIYSLTPETVSGAAIEDHETN